MLLVLAALFVAGSLTVTRAFSAENAARQEMIDAREALSQVNDLMLLLYEAESAQRGVLLDRPGEDLGPFRAAEAALPAIAGQMQASLDRAGSDLSAQGRRLRSLAEQRMTEMSGALASAPAPATTLRSSMADLRQVSDAIRREERALMDAAYARADGERLRAKRTLGMIGAAVLGLIALAALLAFRAARSESRLRYRDEIAAQRDRAELVSRELSHRVKNLFAVTMSIMSVTARNETDPKLAAQKTRSRIQALARAHELSSGQNPMRTAQFGDLLAAVVQPYCPPGATLRRSGPKMVLPTRLLTPMGLIFNELATNSVKYGAWSAPSGTLKVDWTFASDETLVVIWQEQLAETGSPQPGREGFGSTMINLSLQQAKATMERRWGEKGLTAVLRFPLSQADKVEVTATGKD
ncbi:HWE histidine kinase domain-containing protein [Frigidibacter mobilis]|uniref:histidine kinase n=1 Tax=Frigidibacter mobilis TaxID=1335048 RepID=A0A159Z056_9RHOB|nr:HWE histidine kinase domain-containing protein [Frigidibacter mobilis]AMY68221.1 signal transduction histidine kinase [Frigidibacter mobilis]